MFKSLQSILLNGLLILLPVLFLVVILRELIELLVALATPIADLFPADFIDSFPSVNLLAGLLILGAALLVGLLARLKAGAAIGRYIETAVLLKIPVYQPLKTLLQALLGSEASDNFNPALLDGEDGSFDFVYVVEDGGRAHVIVLMPWTPNSFAGSLKLVPRERVRKLDMTFDAFSLRVGHYGVGLSDQLGDVIGSGQQE